MINEEIDVVEDEFERQKNQLMQERSMAARSGDEETVVQMNKLIAVSNSAIRDYEQAKTEQQKKEAIEKKKNIIKYIKNFFRRNEHFGY